MTKTKACLAAVIVALAVVMTVPLLATGATSSKLISRGEYLVTTSGCNDCHTPWKMGPNGPAPDLTRLLSGHPQDMAMPPPARLAPPWAFSVAGTMTAWAGPWGVSFTANLTPDAETGLGTWTAENFIEAMRSGRHMGRGRPILPPMPYANYGKMTDADLHAMFAYLRSIPAIRNRVPEPIPPESAASLSSTEAGGASPRGTGASPGQR